jgi:hypothetical protein
MQNARITPRPGNESKTELIYRVRSVDNEGCHRNMAAFFVRMMQLGFGEKQKKVAKEYDSC